MLGHKGANALDLQNVADVISEVPYWLISVDLPLLVSYLESLAHVAVGAVPAFSPASEGDHLSSS